MTPKDRESRKEHEESVARRIAKTYSVVALWIVLSGAAIMYNKYILAYCNFPFPITLTMWHMFFCSSLACLLVKSGRVASINMERQTYLKAIVPIALCYAGTLWVGNAAYLYLSVSFIQMLKALMPVCVFTVGVLFKVDRFDCDKLANLMVVTAGVAIASYGEINFNVVGVMFQMGSLVSESIRLVLVQILLQSRGLKLNPITTLYYVSPACFCFLLIPWLLLEAGKLAANPSALVSPALLLTNAMVAFGLNLSVFLLIGKTSALTMNISGVVKDWLLIGLSVWLYKSAVTQLNLFGYFIAFLGICWYNYQKLQAMQGKAGEGAQQGSNGGKPPLRPPLKSPLKSVAVKDES